MRVLALAVAVTVVLGSACNCDSGQGPDGGEAPDSGAPDGGRPDAGGPGDAGTPDAGPGDAGADAGEVDAGPPQSATSVGNALEHVESFPPASLWNGAVLAILPDGGLWAAHRPRPGSALVLSRHEPGTGLWQQASDAGNQRPLLSLGTLAVDAQGAPLVAFAQETEANARRAELVLSRFTGGWEPVLPPLLLAGERPGDMDQGSLLLDPAGRPLLAFTDPNDSTGQVLRAEDGGFTTLATLVLVFDPRLTLDADGTPLLTYLQGFAGSNAAALRVARVVGDGGLEPLGGTIDSVPNATASISWPRVAVLGGTRWVFWVRNGVAHAASFDGGAWGESDLGEVMPSEFELAATTFQGDLLLASCNTDFTRVKRYHAGAWQPVLPVAVSARCFIPTFAVDGRRAFLVTSGTNLAEVHELHFR